jgi:hypothetical protein
MVTDADTTEGVRFHTEKGGPESIDGHLIRTGNNGVEAPDMTTFFRKSRRFIASTPLTSFFTWI